MNILIYNGSGCFESAYNHALKQLRLLCSNAFSVKPISSDELNKANWECTARILVVPDGEVSLISKHINAKGIQKIKSFVKGGGSYLGIIGGSGFACSFIKPLGEENLFNSSIKDQLHFYQGTVEFPVFNETLFNSKKTFLCEIDYYDTKTSSILASFRRAGKFLVPQNYKNAKVLARYSGNFYELDDRCLKPKKDLDFQKNACLIECDVGKGKAILSSINIECDIIETIETCCLSFEPKEKYCGNLYKILLSRCGVESFLCQSLSSRAVSYIAILGNNSCVLSKFFDDFKGLCRGNKQLDDFDIIKQDTEELLLDRHTSKNFILLKEGCDYPHLFNVDEFYLELNKYLEQNTKSPLNFRNALFLLTREIGSTQTFLEKNNKFVSILPNGAFMLALNQTKGRGRNQNQWISREGCLQFSFKFKHQASETRAVSLLQYIFGLAVIESILSFPQYSKLPLFLKWPNDIYAKDNPGAQLKKIGGILVNTTFQDDSFLVVAGISLNVANEYPSLCLNNVIKGYDKSPDLVALETIFARILTYIQMYYCEFVAQNSGFKYFEPMYYKRWLHENQTVSVELDSGLHKTIRITGITLEYGLLKGIEYDSSKDKAMNSEILELWPDGNSFDFMSGLITRKC